MSSWRNQYIDLLLTKPDKILSADDIDTIKKLIPKYSQLFVELGSGSGGHLIELAIRNPNTLCIGFELRYKRTFRTAEKAEEKGATNLLVVRADARDLEEFFDRESIDRFYINYPDPWERKKWLKHRLLTKETLPKLLGLLKFGGRIRFKTDHTGYFEDILSLIPLMSRARLLHSTFDLFESIHAAENIPTEFEGLFRSQGVTSKFLEILKTEE